MIAVVPLSAAEMALETWQGSVEMLIVDNGQNGPSHTRFFLRTGRETFELQSPAALTLRAGQTVEVAGRATSSGKVTVTALTTDSSANANPCSTTGEQKVAVILASFPSKALLSSVTPALVNASFFGSGATVDTFIRESSYGETWITGDVLGPFTMDGDYFDQPLSVQQAALRAAAANSVNLTQYNHIVVVAPQGQTGMESGGMALLGCGRIPSPQGTLTASSIWMGAESMVAQDAIVAIAAHELGHAFGLQHARWADYGADAIGPAGATPAAWDATHEYGDYWSNMGRQSAQWAAPQKSLIGWMPQAGVQTVTEAGSYTIAPFESTGGSQALRVSRDATGSDWLWLEYRQPQGIFDTTLPSAAFNGLLAHYEDPALTPTVSGSTPAMYSNLVNFHPGVANVADPLLHAGQTWADPYGGLSLTVTAASAGGLSVSVSYAPAAVCPASLGAAQTFGSSAASGQIAVTGPSGCAWNATASVPWISLVPAVKGSGNGALNFTVGANPDIAPRWGKITAGDAFVVVNQAGTVGGLSLSASSASIPPSGGTGDVAVATNAPDYSWAFGTDVEWITDVESSTFSTLGPCTLRYIVAANDGPARTGHITIDDQVFTVTQAAGAAPGPVTFAQLAPTDAPSARLNHAMTSGPVQGQALLYGGAFNTDFSSETWLWDGANWNLLQPANNPGLLASHAMAYDEARGQVVLFGGQDGVSYLNRNQTWIWDGSNWHQAHPAASPPARFGHAMAYDPVRRKVVLFGGYGDYGESNDTWLWDGMNWTQAVTSISPGARSGQSMTFDAAHREMILFGGTIGYNGVPSWYSDTWAWNGEAWYRKNVAPGPAGRTGHVLAYHPALGVVMVGGAGGKDVTETSWNYDFRRETWSWDGTQWTQQFPDNQPGPAYTLGASYDSTKQRLIFHLGDDLTCDSRGPKTFALTASSRDQNSLGTLRSAPPTPGQTALH
jgi:M6 family metalloprotease-like protein